MGRTTDLISIAIDGPAGAGKSTMAKAAARALGYVYVDTGAIYRAVGYAALERGVSPEDKAGVETLLPALALELRWENDVQHVLLSGVDVSAEIRTPAVSDAASKVAALPCVRAFLMETQRRVAREHNVIMDGRDIGTVVLPDADVKIFLTASAEVRARRRFLELQQRGAPDTYEQVLADMKERDYRDSHREIAPLRPAQDAVVIDSSDQTLEENVQAILNTIRGKLQ